MSKTPFGSFGFKVELSAGGDGGTNHGCFQEVSGISAQLNVTDLVEGGANHTTHKLINNASYSNITLKRGLCDVGLFKWIDGFINGGTGSRMNGTITIYGDAVDRDGKHKPVQVIKFKNAIPVKWDGPALNVSQDAIATETLELAHEGLTVSRA
ncbi:MAG: phage tail protein [Proteobacteria bacterium]|nr:phage tail protein [Pseudomonadota bacterium]